jgi:hypothetical protein
MLWSQFRPCENIATHTPLLLAHTHNHEPEKVLSHSNSLSVAPVWADATTPGIIWSCSPWHSIRSRSHAPTDRLRHWLLTDAERANAAGACLLARNVHRAKYESRASANLESSNMTTLLVGTLHNENWYCDVRRLFDKIDAIGQNQKI